MVSANFFEHVALQRKSDNQRYFLSDFSYTGLPPTVGVPVSCIFYIVLVAGRGGAAVGIPSSDRSEKSNDFLRSALERDVLEKVGGDRPLFERVVQPAHHAGSTTLIRIERRQAVRR